MTSLLAAPFQAEVAAWEQSVASNVVSWTVLAPITFTASNGTVLMPQTDQSLLASGARPEKDTYAITVQPERTDITAFRLEVLADDSLPQKGPGRQDNGNLHLSEIKVLATTTTGGAATSVPLQNASADFDQKGWTSAHAIDGKTNTAWGIHPKVGQSRPARPEYRHFRFRAH